MNKRIDNSAMPAGQRGLSLVEMMVAMVIGLLLIGGVIQIFASNKQGYLTHEALSRIQENGRYAMEIMSRNVRMAGFTGCAALDTVEPNVIANNPPAGGLRASTAVLGYEYDGSSWDPAYTGAPSGVVANTDLVTVNRGADCGAYLVGNMTAVNANIQINADNICNFQANDVIIISDCSSTDIFRASSVSSDSGSGRVTIAHANNQNSSNRLSKPYGTDARIFKLSTYDYYVKLNASNPPQPTLYVREDGTESELVEGVEDMQISYGVDTTGDRAADSYVDADAVTDWGDVASVRVALGLRSINDYVALTETSYSFNGVNVTNRHLRKAMSATIGVRNRLP